MTARRSGRSSPPSDPPRDSGPRRRRASPPRPLTLLHTDDRWVVVEKPAGIPVHGGAGSGGPTVLDRLEQQLGERLHLAHRLDRGTAGVLLLARSGEDARRASELWDQIEKRYWALAFGVPKAPSVFDARLPGPDGRLREAATALDHALVLPGLATRVSACALRLDTGRLHQIRRHLAGAGHPVVLDDRYGDFSANKAFIDDLRARGLPRPKHPFLFCERLRAPSRLGLPGPLRAAWPRAWHSVLEGGGLSVDDLDGLA